jgi:glycosyltransferase involved in cell wall biosynthesis
MRIGLFFSGLAGGGTQRRMLLLARGLIERGHAVTIVVASAEGAFRSALPAAARLVELGGGGRRLPLISRHRGLWVPLGCPALSRFLRTASLDVLVASSTPANLVAAVARARAAPALPLVLVLNLPPSAVARGVGPLAQPLLAVLRRACAGADGLVAISAGVALDAAAALDLDPARIAVVANPVDAGRIARLARARPAHPWLEPGAPPVLLAVGKLQPQKDHATLLRAFALLRTKRPARLVILGEGPLRGRLERLARELGIARDVAFLGFVVDPFGWMAHAAVVVSSSRFEGLSNVLIEALAAGATIVATDCPHGPAEVLGGGAFGRLVPVGDAALLAAAMAAALDDPADPPVQRARARRFAIDAAVEGYLRVLLPLARPVAEAA